MSDDECKALLFRAKWGDKPKCPNCDSDNSCYIKTRKVYKCKDCKRQYSLKQGTIFERTKLPLKTWYAAIFLFISNKRGISSIQLSKNIGVEQRTAWLMLHKLRESLKDENGQVLSGIVEVDEAFCGARKGRDKRVAAKDYERKELRIEMQAEGQKEKQTRLRKEKDKLEDKGIKPPKRVNKYEIIRQQLPLEKRLMFEDKRTRMLEYQPFFYAKNIFGMIERDTKMVNVYGKEEVFKRGRIVLVKLGRHKGEITQKNVMKELKKYVTKNSVVMTDECPAYKKVVKNYFSQHYTVQHTIKKEKENDDKEEKKEKGETRKKGVQYVTKDNESGLEVTTNRIENVWKHFKRMENGTYIQFSWKYTDRYLNEFSYRWNNRDLPVFQLFNDLLGKSMSNSISHKKLFSTEDDYSFIAA